MGRFAVRLLATIVVLAALAAVAALWGYAEFTRPGPLSADATVIVPRGAGVSEIGRLLETAGVVRDGRVFAFGAELSGEGRSLRAGEYRFPARISPRGAVGILKSGKTVVRRLTVPEGLTSRQVVEIVRATEGLFGTIASVPGEGELLPETYHFTYGDSREAMIERMRRGMTTFIAETWPERREGLPIATPAEALIVASLVEKETALADERPRIAAVFYNRLRRGMALQSDPTVIYALAGPDGLGRGLTRADLAVDSPYNTYRVKGLPPGPIGNPGRESLRAALLPAETDDLYFVADGRGGHAFARTLDEHNRNVARWLRSGEADGRPGP